MKTEKFMLRTLIILMGLTVATTLAVFGEEPAASGTVALTTPVSGPQDPASGKPALDFKAGSLVWLEGNSTLHRFYFTATQVSATSEVEAGAAGESLAELILKKKVHSLTVTIPVEGLKSGEEGMDKNAYSTLKATQFPNIVFKLSDYAVKAFPGSENTYALLAWGKLKIAGQERDVTLDATLVDGPDGPVLYGNQDILQKDYGVAPYSMALVMSVDNKIVVHYRVKLGVAAGKP